MSRWLAGLPPPTQHHPRNANPKVSRPNLDVQIFARLEIEP